MKRLAFVPFAFSGSTFLALSLVCTGTQLFSPAATPTRTVTPTRTPTHTPRPTRTLRLTATVTPSPTPTPATSTEKRPDGTTVFSDYETGYRLTLPSAWIVLDITREGIAAALRRAATANPDIAPQLAASMPPLQEGMRVVAFDGNLKLLASQVVPYLSVIRVDNTQTHGAPVDLFLGITARSLETVLPGAKLLEAKMVQREDGFSYGRIDLTLKAKDLRGKQVDAREVVILAQAPNDVIMMTLASGTDQYSRLAEDFASVIGSLEIPVE